MVKLILVNTNDIKRYNMYKVKKKVHSEAKPTGWLGFCIRFPRRSMIGRSLMMLA